MKQMRNNSANNQRDGNRGETAFAQCLGKVFGITGPLSNMAISSCLFLLLSCLVFFALWKITGINWASYAVAGCFLTGIAASAIAFAAQTASQSIRTAEFARAKVKGEKPREFKEGTPEFAKIMTKCFRFAKSLRGKRERDKRQICVRTRNRARSRHRSARPAFEHASNSPGGGSSDDGSGDSDPGDPPERQNSVTPSDSSEQPNKQNHPWRSPGRFRMPRRSQRRRFA
jgi:hypothetical protein